MILLTLFFAEFSWVGVWPWVMGLVGFHIILIFISAIHFFSEFSWVEFWHWVMMAFVGSHVPGQYLYSTSK